LMGVMGSVTIWAINVFNSPATGGTRFTGTQQEKMLILGLFGVLMVFGFLSFIAGLWQLILGRRNKIFVWAGVGLGALILIGAVAIRWVFT
jgi:hypothetical protein